jgi:hypothetical protein
MTTANKRVLRFAQNDKQKASVPLRGLLKEMSGVWRRVTSAIETKRERS